ncbi:glycosidase [Xylanimonas oleitrophica]|uniref:Glycosidase n=1 Tax=Xylanimonas oleitrophica TaxID=2607479 RepID=A0A2W5WZ73_9MICO|nr:alpha-amylase family protein [Xylanimonas oleitrophica]PZR53185.1 glycosidase [Xylanimonas oleitrophica]
MSVRSSWYGNAVIYQADPRLYFDSDGDGWGDLRGMTERLDYLRGLGATALWLLPFYTSPFRDGGYDVADHLAVDPRLGDLADMARLLEAADELGIHVLVELVCQHTSDQHRWFQEARHDRKSPYRDYYVWADEPTATSVEPRFPDVEDGVWTWDEEAQQFYRHTFYSFEPDLALDNPRVRDELERIMTFWLRMGVSGFRVDAVPFMVERAAQAPDRPEHGEDGQWLVREMRDVVSSQSSGAVLLGEVDVEPQAYADYFGTRDTGEGDGMTMLLDFWLNNHLFLALARGDASPLVRALEQQPRPPRHAQYAQWLRNNDELDLEQLTEAERHEVLRAFAPTRRMRLYGRGIRRRLAPMLDGDVRRVALAHAVLFSLPGPPVLRYGDEIGMGDDLSLPEREAVRTPMQWTDGPNGGFSQADPGSLAAPVVSEGPYSYENVNVYDQTVRGDSLLSRVGDMIRARLGLRETGLAEPEPVRVTGPGDEEVTTVLALRYVHESSSVIMLANLADEDVEVTLHLGPAPAGAGHVGDDGRPEADDGALVDVLADHPYARATVASGPDGERCPRVQLSGYGYRWLRPRDHAWHDVPR